MGSGRMNLQSLFTVQEGGEDQELGNFHLEFPLSRRATEPIYLLKEGNKLTELYLVFE